LGSDSGHHAGHDGEPPPGAGVDTRVLAIEDRSGADGNSDIKFGADVQAVEPRRADADDLEGMMVEGERAAEGVRSTAEMILPETVADDRERRAAALVVGNGE
jgi:hypothetical protein